MVLYLSLTWGMAQMLFLNNLLPRITMQKIDKVIEVSALFHGLHEDIT
jgi:hypothetical protein